jgi:putative ABC transport system permease protein
MIRFLMKGLLRDRSRSLFPLLTVVIGVLLTVLAYSYVKGAFAGIVDSSARFKIGHLRIMSRAYAEEQDQIPNDLAYIGLKNLLKEVRKAYPDIYWTPRIYFGGLLDIPDEQGETKAQAPITGMSVDLLTDQTPEKDILNLEKALIRGHLPEKPGEILISEALAFRLEVQPGDEATLIGSTMSGSLAADNFIIAGTIRFGVTAMDQGAMLADIEDIQVALNMEDAVGEILGYYPDGLFHEKMAEEAAQQFNRQYSDPDDEYSPVMVTLRSDKALASYLDYAGTAFGLIIGIFVVIMSIVLWNVGLMGSLRRYGEIGIRLAIGEDKGHVYRSMIGEALLVGFFGSAIGTLFGLAISYYIQMQGIDISGMLQDASMVMPDVLRTQVTFGSFYIGFIPGLLATLLGTAISGIGIYKRQTSRLAKEMES